MCHYNYSDVGNSGTDDVSQVNYVITKMNF